MKKIIAFIIALVVGFIYFLISLPPTPEPKTICIKDKEWYSLEYGYGFTLSGKIGWGFINKHHYECLKYGPNPKYKDHNGAFN